MKIGIDCRMMGSQQAGLGRYVEQLVLGLNKIIDDSIDVFTKRGKITFVLFVNEDINRCFATDNTDIKKVIVNIPWYSWQEQIKFKKIIDKENLDLMHFPHWNVPLLYNKPFVVTVHDLIMYHYPRQEASTHGPLVYWLKDLAHRLVLRHAVKKARHVIVTSEFTKQDVHETLKVPLDKMTVVYQAPFEITNYKLQITNKSQNPNDKNISERFKISKPYVLYVGNAYPHKNLEGLIKAWKIFCEKYGSDYQLVLVGKKNFFYEKILKDYKIERLKDCEIKRDEKLPITNYQLPLDHSTVQPSNNIVFTGYLSDSELVEIYQHASLYVFPSLYEGFGLPPLEAEQYGVPVVSSNSSCLPEILSESALYFDPENYEQMAETIYCGLTDENVRFELKKNAQENLQRFNLKNMCNQTLEIYNNLC